MLNTSRHTSWVSFELIPNCNSLHSESRSQRRPFASVDSCGMAPLENARRRFGPDLESIISCAHARMKGSWENKAIVHEIIHSIWPYLQLRTYLAGILILLGFGWIFRMPCLHRGLLAWGHGCWWSRRWFQPRSQAHGVAVAKPFGHCQQCFCFSPGVLPIPPCQCRCSTDIAPIGSSHLPWILSWALEIVVVISCGCWLQCDFFPADCSMPEGTPRVYVRQSSDWTRTSKAAAFWPISMPSSWCFPQSGGAWGFPQSKWIFGARMPSL